MVKLPQIQTGQLLDLLQPVHQGVAVDEQLTGSFGNVQVVLEELIDGEQSFLIQGIDGVLFEHLGQEDLTQGGGQLIDQTADTQILIVEDGLLGFKYLAHFNGGLGFLVGICQLPQMLGHGADADNGLDEQLTPEGIFNVGGKGRVKVGEESFELDFKEALYLGAGDREVVFESVDSSAPAKFYFNSCVAHHTYPDCKVTKADAIVAHMGSLEGSNDRNINKMLVREVLPTCQLQMGMTELMTGSVWNTMPAHVHSRRMEAYFYFEVPEEHAVCHFMGEVDETRHIWMRGEQAVLSPEWSIHSAAATHNYTFIWGMGGENLDYSDQDFSLITDLK